MQDFALRVEELGKYYRIGAQQKQINGFRKSIYSLLTSPFAYLRSTLRQPSDEEVLWALKDVSFEVKIGEVLGIIGHNGAGKSTLLKILSRITEPTEGRAMINGRVGSLLEVGTGFHPELTGRENIYMNGSILGMRHSEISNKFDEIVAFAGVEKFIDTPVKRYSSGMYVRLAFAVAAHLETEILLVDEVLAVGDAAFRKKSLGKLETVSQSGRTALFVSHNMAAVQNLCDRVIWLGSGRVIEEGQPDRVISNYLKTSSSTHTEHVWDDIATAPGNDEIRLHRVCVRPKDGSPVDPITMQTPFVLEFEYWTLVPNVYFNLNFHLISEQGIVAFASSSLQKPLGHNRPFPMGLIRSVCHVPGNLLNSGVHTIKLRVVRNGHFIIYQDNEALTFEIQDYSSEQRGSWYGKRAGVVRPLLKWTTDLVKEENEVVVT